MRLRARKKCCGEEKMEPNPIRYYPLLKELAQLFDLESNIDTVLAVSMIKLNQYMDTERSSVFLFDPLRQVLTSFSSLDLDQREIQISKSVGVSGWVFENRTAAIVNNAYDDNRFHRKVDELTGFRTRNLICCPLIDYKDKCLGTLQSLNKKGGDFTREDLALLDLAARMVAVALSNSRRYNDIRITNEARRKFIAQILHNAGDLPEMQ